MPCIGREGYGPSIRETKILHSGKPFSVTLDFCKDKILLSYNNYVVYTINYHGGDFFIYEGDALFYRGRKNEMKEGNLSLSGQEASLLEALLDLAEEHFYGY